METREKILELIFSTPKSEQESERAYALRLSNVSGFSDNYIRKVYRKNILKIEDIKEPEITSTKVEDNFDYDSFLDEVIVRQKKRLDSKLSQDYATWNIKTEEPVYVMFWGDQHIGASGMDAESFKRLTDELLDTPNLYCILMGDSMEMAINMRSVHEVMGNIIPPMEQYRIFEAWLDKIKHKVICATWCNHNVMREEKVLGWSPTAYALSQKVIYHNNIGITDIVVNDITYKLSLSHFFRGNSMYNPNHELARYIRHENGEVDIVAQGDKHTPAIQTLYIQEKVRGLIKCGTHNVNSGYAKRFFSLKTFQDMPVVRLMPHKKMFTLYLNLEQAMA